MQSSGRGPEHRARADRSHQRGNRCVVGLNVFVVKSVAHDVPMATVFRGVLPFWFAMVACLLAIVAFPQIALMIPEAMFR